MESIKIYKINEVFMRFDTDHGVKHELNEYFAFRPPGYQFNPRYKARVWDGYIRMYRPMENRLYLGLIPYIKKFCADRGYELTIDDEVVVENKVDDDYGYWLAERLKVPYTPHDYQNEYVVHAIRDNRAVLSSPTGSGKSLMIYLLANHYKMTEDLRTIIIVPTVSLVHQMASDFVEYGGNEEDVYKIKSGVSKDTDKQFVITTWQSVYKLGKEWFDQFGVVIGDEAHLFQAKSLMSIMEKMTDCKYRFGLTGTVKKDEDSKVHKLVLEGLFGKVKKIVKTKDLIDRGTLASFNIKAIVLNHITADKKELAKIKRKMTGPQSKMKYSAECKFVMAHEARNNFIKNLVKSLKGQNNLILLDQVENHGDVLAPMLEFEDRILHYIHGGVSGEKREEMRHLIEQDPIKQHDILATFGTLSTGVNLKRLDNIIFAFAGKSEVKVFQSIGRSLRKGNGADEAALYDISDDLSTGSSDNYLLTHFKDRVKMYQEEEFKFKVISVNL
mgnify:CR=1 FL=1